MLKIQSLASGSKGNVIYISDGVTNILVDQGLGLRELGKRMEAIGLDPRTVNAVLVTHEHSDHIKGVAPFLKNYPNVVLYLPDIAVIPFLSKIGRVPDDCFQSFNEKFNINDIEIDFFELQHDSEFCFGYVFKNGDCKISLATDLGIINEAIIKKMAGSQIVLIESNHDTTKLSHNAKYPSWLKRRVAGPHGHLSNVACSAAVYQLATTGVQQVILAHLSEENNTPTLALSVVRDFLASKGIIEGQDINIDVATQFNPSNLFQVE